MSLEPEPTYKSSEAKYDRFNFHPASEVDRLANLLGSQSADSARVIVLAGTAQCGRRYLAEAALYRLRQRNLALRYCRIDLDGYEIGEESLDNYVAHQLLKLPAASEPRAKAILDRMKVQFKLQTPSAWGISLFSVALTADMPLGEVFQLLDNTFESLPAGHRSPGETLSLALRRLASHQRLVVHVLDSAALPAQVLQLLIDETLVGSDLMVLLSAGRSDHLSLADGVAKRMEVPLIAENEVRPLGDERFHPNEFSAELLRALWLYSKGYPGRLAIKFVDLLAADLIVENAEGCWTLRAGLTLNSPELADVFSVDEMERVRSQIAAMPEPLQTEVRAFTEAAALCGDTIPVRSIAGYVGVSAEAMDGFIDVLDDSFEPPVFEDLGYGHPSFKRELIYRFYNPVTAASQAGLISKEKRTKIADDLLRLIGTKVDTRGRARLCMRLSRYSSEDVQREFERVLAWWANAEESSSLTEFIRRAVLSHKLRADTVINDVQRHYRYNWPPHRSNAILDGLIDDTGQAMVPQPRMGDFYVIRARILLHNGRVREAESAAMEALEVINPDLELAADVAITRSTIKRIEGDTAAATAFLEEAQRILTNIYGSGGQAIMKVEFGLAGLYKQLERYEEAEALYKRHLPFLMRSGNSSPDLATHLDNLALVVAERGRLDEAEAFSRKALDIFRGTIGEETVDAALAKGHLALIYKYNGKSREATDLLEEAAATLEAQAGPEHPELASVLENLGGGYEDAGDYPKSEQLRLRSLKIFERAYGPKSPYTAAVLNNLGVLYQAWKRYNDAVDVVERALEITIKLPGSTAEEIGRLSLWLDNLKVTDKEQSAHPGEAEAAGQG